MSEGLPPSMVACTPSGNRYHKIIWAGTKIFGRDKVATRCGLDSMFGAELTIVDVDSMNREPCRTCYGKSARRRREDK